ncbi:helix-turn-helix domain-containing protein [Noviherbaspirillum pedocola]|uniref:Helix-turn-helix transcriptional regulator n=1 Tax=Noviherbaspirillum pedocola TaxID=2801341 RepID=A0A934W888_9BURK|nr:helix-turn-helix transcriptional regulator [Noviherbaspirillum pedocola]MBK4735534.1 helix-turn-helix transcriptional regulator [Noviherbaspirillum pedocola]
MKKKNINTLRTRIASEVKQARSHAGLSQEALAMAAEVDRTYVSQLERAIANPSIEILQRIADALGVELVITFQSSSSSIN